MTEVETIKFNLFLNPTYQILAPYIKVFVDDEMHYEGIIKKPTTVTFTTKLNFGSHKLKIVKEKTQPNQLLTIDAIEIDGVNIRDIVWNYSYNLPEYPEPWASEQKALGITLEEKVMGETCLGHNGTWILNFTSPFYMFVFDWMKANDKLVS